MKLNQETKNKIKEDYETGQFSRVELAQLYNVSKRTIDYVLKNSAKRFKYDAMDKAISLDALQEKGRDIPDSSKEPLKLLTHKAEYSKIVKCPTPGCHYKTTVNKLLVHLIKNHARYDLEYLL